MGRGPHCSKDGLNKGAWTSEEDKILTGYVKIHGEGRWSNVAKKTGLKRCGKSCRLRWMNYLRPDIKRGNISLDEEELIVRLHKLLGNRWSLIAGRLPGRTDNEIKNYWNTNLAKKAQDCFKLTLPKLSNKPRPLHEEVPTPPPPHYRAIKEKPDTNTAVQNHIGKDQVRQHDPKINVGPPGNDNVVLQAVRIHGETTTTCSTVSPPSSISGDENNHLYSSDQLIMHMDFNMDDFCKILDSDFARICEGHDVGSSVPALGEEGHEVVLNIDCDVEVADVAPKKLEENWSEECAQVDEAEGSDFMSLISFLDSVPAEWQEII